MAVRKIAMIWWSQSSTLVTTYNQHCLLKRPLNNMLYSLQWARSMYTDKAYHKCYNKYCLYRHHWWFAKLIDISKGQFPSYTKRTIALIQKCCPCVQRSFIEVTFQFNTKVYVIVEVYTSIHQHATIIDEVLDLVNTFSIFFLSRQCLHQCSSPVNTKQYIN